MSRAIVLADRFELLHNAREAARQEFELARVAFRACLDSYSVSDPHEVARLAAAQERKMRAAELRGWE